MTIDEKIDSLKQALYQAQYEKYCIESVNTPFNAKKETLIDYVNRVVVAVTKDSYVNMLDVNITMLSTNKVLVEHEGRDDITIIENIDGTLYKKVYVESDVEHVFNYNHAYTLSNMFGLEYGCES